MILFLSSWHLVSVLGVFLGCSAFLGVTGILWAAWRAVESQHALDLEVVRFKRERRSAAAKKGHETRKAKQAAEGITAADLGDVDYRIQATITPDDALVGEDQ